MARIATGGGDRGETSLFGGTRVPKDHPRVAAYGAVDEANAALGLAAEAVPASEREALRSIQRDLFAIGAELATPGPKRASIRGEHVAVLDRWLDTLEAGQPPLKTFVLPGGSEASARFHVARTSVRRAERAVVALHHAEPVRHEVLVYLNRLSDLLFLLARHDALRSGGEVRMDFGPYEPGA